MKVKSLPVRIKAAGEQDGTEDGVFEAIVATYDIDSYGDKIVPGAFKDTLDEWKSSGSPIPVLWSHMSHDPDYHIGEVLEAEERDEGLWVKARIDLDEPKAGKVYKLLKGRRVTQFSFAYDIEEAGFVDKVEDGRDESYFELRKLKLFEVGPCLIGANQNTELLDVKSRDQTLRIELPQQHGVDTDAIRRAVVDAMSAKAGRTLSAKNEQRVRDIAKLAKELLDELSSSDEDEKATPAPSAKSAPDGAADVATRPGTASLRLRTDLAAFEAEVDELTN